MANLRQETPIFVQTIAVVNWSPDEQINVPDTEELLARYPSKILPSPNSSK